MRAEIRAIREHLAPELSSKAQSRTYLTTWQVHVRNTGPGAKRHRSDSSASWTGTVYQFW